MSLYTALVSLYAKVNQSDVENLQPTLTKNVKQLLKKNVIVISNFNQINYVKFVSLCLIEI